jgi:hypothetical protein
VRTGLGLAGRDFQIGREKSPLPWRLWLAHSAVPSGEQVDQARELVKRGLPERPTAVSELRERRTVKALEARLERPRTSTSGAISQRPRSLLDKPPSRFEMPQVKAVSRVPTVFASPHAA